MVSLQERRSLVARAWANSGLISLSDQVVASLTNFLTGVIVGRACVPEHFGYYTLCMSVVLFALDLQTSLISAPYLVFSQRLTGAEHARYSGSTLLHQLLLGLLTAALLTGGVLGYSVLYGARELTAVIWVLTWVISFIMLRDYIRKICFASLRMHSALLIDTLVAVCQLGLLLLLAHRGLLSAGTTYAVVGATCAVMSAGWLYLNRHLFSFTPGQLRTDFVQNWTFGKWIFASGLLWALSMNIYPWLLTAFHGAEETAVWGACFGVAAIGNPVLLGIQNFLGPKIIRAHAKGGKPLLARFIVSATLLFLLIIMPFALLLLMFGDQLLIWVYGATYQGHGVVISLLALNLLVAAATFTLSRAFYAVERADLYFAANFVPLIILFTFGIILVKAWGPLGVACSMVLTSTITAVVMLFLFLKIIRSS